MDLYLCACVRDQCTLYIYMQERFVLKFFLNTNTLPLHYLLAFIICEFYDLCFFLDNYFNNLITSSIGKEGRRFYVCIVCINFAYFCKVGINNGNVCKFELLYVANNCCTYIKCNIYAPTK